MAYTSTSAFPYNPQFGNMASPAIPSSVSNSSPIQNLSMMQQSLAQSKANPAMAQMANAQFPSPIAQTAQTPQPQPVVMPQLNPFQPLPNQPQSSQAPPNSVQPMHQGWSPPPNLSGNNLGNMPPSQSAPNPPTQSIAQQALAGGNNPQAVQNLMQALKGVGAGNNNAGFTANNNPQAQQVSALYPQTAQPQGGNNNLGNMPNPQTAQPQGLSGNNLGNIMPNPQTARPTPPLNQQIPINPAIRSSALSSPLSYNATNPRLMTNVSGVGANMANQQSAQQSPVLSGSIGASLGGSVMSDEDAKEDIINDPHKEIRDFIGDLTNNSYTYKNPEHGEGTHYGPMAQDLEKTAVGRSAVMVDPQTGLKKVDTGRLSLINAGAMALLHDRLSKLEAARK